MKVVNMQQKKFKFSPKIVLCLTILISALSILGVVFWYCIEPAYQVFLTFPTVIFLFIVFLFCNIFAVKNIQTVISKIILGISLGILILCGSLIFNHVPLKANFFFLKNSRLNAYTLAQNGELSVCPFNKKLLSPPSGKENLAFDGILYLNTPADKGVIFYFSTGFMSEIEEGLLYKPEKAEETLFSSGTKIIVLDENWIYFKGKFENIFEKP